jgi:signal transduction histidine kinase
MWYGVATLALLLTALLAMRHFARRALLEAHEAAVERSAALVRSFFRAELAEYRRVDVTVSHLAGELVFAGMTIEFLRPDGTTFATARQPLAAATPPAPFSRRTQALDDDLAPGWRLRLTISIADLSAARAAIDRLTLVSIPVAALLATLVAWWMTGRALSPVGHMAAAADKLQGASGSRLPIANVHDEFGRLGTAFNGLLDRLDKALQEQRRFLADAAHELRTPVARLLGIAEARLTHPPEAQDRQAIEGMAAELRRTSTLIDELLYLGRADSGALSATRVDVFLDDLVSDVVARASLDADAKGLTLDPTGLAETPVRGDATLLARLTTALLDNAVRYTPRGGVIRVTTRKANNDVAQLVIEDSGIGVAEAERESIFARFGRGQAARQLAPEGAGLGLAIARSIVDAHGGTLLVDDSDLGGARFTATIPS